MSKWGVVVLQASQQCEEEICYTNLMTFVENKHMDGTINDSWVKGELILKEIDSSGCAGV